MQVPQSRVLRDGHLVQVPAARRRAGRRRGGRGGRHRAGGRPAHPLGHARGAGGGAHRRERPGRQGRGRPAGRRRRPRRPGRHAVPEHLGDAGHRRDGRDGHRHGHRDGPDRDDADLGHAGPVAAAEGARLADQGAGRHRLDARSRSSSSSACCAASPSTTWCCSARRWRSRRSRPGMPAFVSGLLSLGAKQLAEARAVVKNLTDVETLGATSAINTDKTGTLTMNEMMVSTIYAGGTWFNVTGQGYGKTGTIESVAGVPVPDFTRLALGLALDTDATVGDDGAVIGDPTEAALVVLAAKLGVNAEETRRAYPRLAEVPFDSAYKFMATFHRVTVDGAEHVIELVKGGPDVVFDALHPRRRPAQRLAGPDRRRARGPRRGQRAHGRAGPARARLRRPPGRRRRAGRDDRRPDVAHPRPGLRRDGGDDRPAARRGEGRRDHGARGRDRRADDHRRQPDHRQRHRGVARARAGRDQRDRVPGAVRRGGRRPPAPAARLRPGDARGQAAAGPPDAGARDRSSPRPATRSTTPSRSSRPTSASRWAAAARSPSRPRG